VSVTAHDARLSILNALEARLRALPTEPTWPTLTVYADGEVPDQPAVLTTPAGRDKAGRIATYAVIYPSPGSRPYPDFEGGITEGAGDFQWSGQITFTGGYQANVLDMLDRAIPWLESWMPEIDGLACGWFEQNPNTTPPTLRRNPDVKPSRFSVPTLWRVHVATA
jgi:N-dimethylarginine dimethylaminohydrolase